MIPWKGRTNSHVATVDKMVCNCVLDCGAMAALVQTKGFPIEEDIRSGLALWVGFEWTEEKVEAVEERGRRRS